MNSIILEGSVKLRPKLGILAKSSFKFSGVRSSMYIPSQEVFED